MTDDNRVAALTDLVELRVPVSAALAALQPFPWDSDELVTVRRTDVAAVLERFVSASLSAAEVVAWAESVHLRDDIAREEGAEDTVNEVLIEMSSPELFGDLSEIAPALLERLR
jgi:hypothetical protein